MNDHHKHTEFLKHCIGYDESARSLELENEIKRIQRDARCVRRALWHLIMLTSLALVALGYGLIFGDNFPYNAPQFIINLVCGLGLGSLVCFVSFMGLGFVYRIKLDHQREECRRLVTELLKSRLSKPDAAPLENAPLIEASQ